MKDWGFEKGWGDSAERVKDTMRTLSEVLQAPDPMKMELLFSRLPNMFNIVVFSPHGYFGQADVLGLPDTGGQVWSTDNVTITSSIIHIFIYKTCMTKVLNRWFTF